MHHDNKLPDCQLSAPCKSRGEIPKRSQLAHCVTMHGDKCLACRSACCGLLIKLTVHLKGCPTPNESNDVWSFGSMADLCLMHRLAPFVQSPHPTPNQLAACRLFMLQCFVHLVGMLLLPRALRRYITPSRPYVIPSKAHVTPAVQIPARTQPAEISKDQNAIQGEVLLAGTLLRELEQLLDCRCTAMVGRCSNRTMYLRERRSINFDSSVKQVNSNVSTQFWGQSCIGCSMLLACVSVYLAV